MKWEEVRKEFPDTFVKIQVLKSHIEGNVRYIDDMEVVQAFDDDKEATRELVRAKDDLVVYHTAKKEIKLEIKDIFGYRGVV